MLKNIFGSPRLGVTVVSIIVTTGFFGVLILLLLGHYNVTGEVADIVKVMTGLLGAKFGDVVGYHINSSSGSKAKDDIFAAQLKPPTAS